MYEYLVAKCGGKDLGLRISHRLAVVGQRFRTLAPLACLAQSPTTEVQDTIQLLIHCQRLYP